MIAVPHKCYVSVIRYRNSREKYKRQYDFSFVSKTIADNECLILPPNI